MSDVLGYMRVSTEEQARSGLGLGAQRSRIADEADRRGWSVERFVDEGWSAADLRRPAVAEALARLTNRTADTLVVARLDRLSRSLVDFAGLMDRVRREGWSLVALDLGADTTSPSGEMMANAMPSFAQYERRLIGQRTREALAERKRQGVRLGRPVELADATRQRIVTLRERGLSYRKIAEKLTADGVPTARGGDWHGSTIQRVLRSVALDRQAAASAAASPPSRS